MGLRFSKVAPTTTATAIVSGDQNRSGLTLVNVGDVTVYIDTHSGVTTSTGFPILPDDTLVIEGTTEPVYGITASGTGDIRVADSK